MSYWVALAIGAVLGCASLGLSLLKRPMNDGYPIQGFVTAAILGSLIWGTGIWLLAKAF